MQAITPEALAALPRYTPEELALRDGQQQPDVWVAYQGRIYDVSNSPLFQGGRHFRLTAGRDLTQEFDRAPHTDRVFEHFQVVGLLVSGTQPGITSTKAQ